MGRRERAFNLTFLNAHKATFFSHVDLLEAVSSNLPPTIDSTSYIAASPPTKSDGKKYQCININIIAMCNINNFNICKGNS